MPQEKVLYTTKWLTLMDKGGYIYVKNMTETAVAVLPFQLVDGELQYLARIEPVPPHDPQVHQCSLTGGVEEGELPKETAIRELFEESGYRAEEVRELGWVYVSKASTTRVHLYAVDVTGQTPEEAPGDGTDYEAQSSTVWLSASEAYQVPDALFGAMISRMHFYVFEEER